MQTKETSAKQDCENAIWNYVNTWTSFYNFTIHEIKANNDKFDNFVVEFSHPTFEKPIPETSLKVFFKVPINW